MKIKHLLIGLLAMAAAVACKQDEPVETPKLDVDKTAVSLAATAGEATFNVTTNQDWTASPDADWVSVDPATGKGSEKAVAVKVTAEDNTSEEPRTAKITVKAGELTKTVSVTQAGGQGEEPGPGPGPDAETYLLVGDAVGGWNFDNPVVLTLAEGYYVAKEVGVAGEKDMHFTKNSSWEGNVKGLHGRIAPNEIGEVGDNNISLTVGGAYDIYLTEALDKFYFMTPGKTPAEAVEHVEIATVWGICGAIDGNSWGASKDPVLAQEGEWFVAKGITFTELNFKVRGNNTWAEDMKWGCVSKEQKCELNKAIAVSTCAEYKATTGTDEDNPNVYIEAPAGAYDIYFSPEKKEVWVMTQGYKPGDETPELEVTYTVTGTIKGTDVDKKANYWNSSNEPGLMTLEGDYYVAKGVEFDYDYRFSDDGTGEDFVKFKICETGTWNAYGQAEEAINKPNAEITVLKDGKDIYLDRSGTYDVYFDKENGKVWVMAAGYAPGEEIAKLDGCQWVAEYDDREVLFDFGLTEEGMLCIALPNMDETAFVLHMTGFYEIEEEDKSSGLVYYVGYDWEWDEMLEEEEFEYTDLTATSVKLVCESVFGVSDPVTLTRVQYPYEIEIDGGGSGEPEPEGPIANGGYWLTNSGKVMAPMAEDATSGTCPAKDLIGFASTVKNTFTFTYDPDWTYYTIQDSYGRYLGNESWGEDISLTTVLPTGEDYAYYLWAIDDSYSDGTVDIYNAASGNGFAYSAANNNWYLDPASWETDGIRPFIVAADNPVEEPVEPEVPSFEAGQYFVMDGKGKVVSPIAESATYGYWNVQDAVEDAGSYIGYAENVFTIAAVDGGYTIQDVYERYHYMTTYNSFSLSKSTQSDNSHVWTITLQDDGTYAIVNTVSGKTVQFSSYGNYAPYTDVTGALPYLVKADKVAEKPEVPEEEAAQFATNVTCTTVSSAYTDGVATVNGVSDVYTLKLGTSKLNGKATITLPAGTTEVTYYAVGWKGTSAKLQFSVAGSVVGTQSLAANTGATGTSPYTMTVSDSDHYTFSLGSALEADTEVTVETTGSAYRAIIFGIQAK